ncbi:MAG: pilus assembly protein PilB [Cyanobacteria bacterium J06632_22]
MHSSPDTSPSQPAAELSDATPVKADINQMFVLIEGILPFEACLYYQVLPLSIEGSCLNLGMVNLGDQAAADYVRRLVSYINCSIVPRQIPSDWHRGILSKFLSHSAKNRSSAPSVASPAPSPTTSSPPASSPPEPQPAPARQQPVPSPRPSAPPTPAAAPAAPFAEQPTLVVNAPDDLASDIPAGESRRTPQAGKGELDPVEDNAAAMSPAPAAVPTSAPQPASNSSATNSSSGTTANALPSLQHLPPKALTEALFDRVIDEGIGRLYLERQPQAGRILWSKDGVLQSVLEQIDVQVFQGVINELKLMVSLSLIPARKPRQVELERSHRGQPILLRFRLIPGTYGEEATLQVLRGAALKFYQQQQIEKMGRDALGVAQTLQQRLNEIRRQARQSLPTDPVPNETLPAIVEMLKNMEQQVHEMMNAPDQ